MRHYRQGNDLLCGICCAKTVIHRMRGEEYAERVTPMMMKEVVEELCVSKCVKSAPGTRETLDDQRGTDNFSFYAIQGVLRRFGVAIEAFEHKKSVETAFCAPKALFDCIVLNKHGAHWKCLVNVYGEGWYDMDSLFDSPKKIPERDMNHHPLRCNQVSERGTTPFFCFRCDSWDFNTASLAMAIQECKVLVVMNCFSSFHVDEYSPPPDVVRRFITGSLEDDVVKLEIDTHRKSSLVVFVRMEGTRNFRLFPYTDHTFSEDDVLSIYSYVFCSYREASTSPFFPVNDRGFMGSDDVNASRFLRLLSE